MIKRQESQIKTRIQLQMRNLKFSASLCLLLAFFEITVQAQSYNNNPKISYINHDVPKSPESTSFEKYGKTPVGEYTGTASVNVPFYTLQAKDVSVPINLSYHASGIKVSQEATWVGLGWDLVPGGRITLQIRGGYDKYTDQYYLSPYGNTAQKMMKYMASQVASYPKYGSIAWGCAAIYSPSNPAPWGSGDPTTYVGNPAVFCDVWYNHPNFSRQDLNQFLYISSKHGALEPDVYNVSFLGKSFSFYKQPFTNKIIMKDENYLYKVEELSGGSWTVTDDNGIRYVFQQEEKTHYVTPLAGLYPDITTSWLLTKIICLNGDVVNFSYANYGDEFPAPEIVESETTELGPFTSTPFQQRTNRNNSSEFFYIKPQYLTKIESKNTVITFNLSYRDDIGGLGTRKLDEIIVESKATNDAIKRMKFNYEYFASNSGYPLYMDANLLNITSHGSTTAEQRLSQRLKLTSVDIGGKLPQIYEQTYRFIYNPLLLPNKVSTSQDHWGYFNGVNNINQSTGSMSFTPTLQSLAAEGIISTPYPQGTDASLAGHANRKADNAYAQANMLTSVIYPTGGYSNFEYELHQSFLNLSAQNFTGGGLRIKRISNFSSNDEVESVLSYDYKGDNNLASGLYLGSIDYLNSFISWGVQGEGDPEGQVGSADQVTRTLLSNGNLNIAGSPVGYRRVVATYVDRKNGTNNYSTIKYFNVKESSPVNSYGTGAAPQAGATFVPWFLHLPPTPEGYTAGLGKLSMEKHLNSQGQVVQVTNNYYKQNMILDSLYSLKIRECSVVPPENQSSFRPIFNFVFEPVRSYFTTLDSTTTTLYEQGQPIKTKTEMAYNNYYQPEKITNSSSDGGVSIQYINTPLSYTTLPALPGLDYVQGNARAAQYLRMKNILNVPIEKILTKKPKDLTEVVTAGGYFKYDENANVMETYQLETNSAIPINQFQKSSYINNGGNNDFVVDNRYKIKQTASYYSPANQLRQITDNGITTSFIMDTLNMQTLAVAKNALHADIAYCSFENNDSGNWQLYSNNINTNIAHTGKKSFNVGGSNAISKTINTAGDYIVSYWSNSGSLTVNGTNANALQTLNGWTYNEHKITVSANSSVQLSGNAVIDELRLYPANALLTTYTYEPLIGITTVDDPKSQSAYYEYDNFGRLKYVKDQAKNIIKSYEQHYINISGVVPTNIYFNEAITVSVAKACPSGQQGSLVPYNIPANKYSSLISQADANQKAQAEINTNSQNNANALGTCTTPTPRPTFSLSYSISSGTFREFQVAVTDTVTNQTEYYTISGSGSLDNIPGGNGYISINEITYNGLYNFYLDSLSDTGVYVQFGTLPITGNMSLYIVEL